MFKKIKKWFVIAYEFVVGKARYVAPVAIKLVEGIKKVVDSPVDDVVLFLVKEAIPGKADDALIDKIHNYVIDKLPVLLTSLTISKELLDIEDKNEQLKAILEHFSFTDDQVKDGIYHLIASSAIEALSDGKLTWSEAVILAELYYEKIVK